ncbi:unnamed protein product [Dibothriocephalus latus]|uniref:Uncharacterized protein n=1 Tax=Dibothriocephalus latus TaxID=60516 RepID=A0A3P6UPS5_DIBLA|nr:unnamed protein product [Dibothriocephalus latus]
MSVEYISKAKIAVMSITKSRQVDLAYNFERLCHKIGSLLERYCLNAGLFKEVLFSNVYPPDCLNYVRQRPAPTVEPTIKQFNQVYRLVITTILEPHVNSQSSSLFDNPALASTLPPTSASVPPMGTNFRHGESVPPLAIKTAVGDFIQLPSLNSQQQDSGLMQRTDRIAKWVSVTAADENRLGANLLIKFVHKLSGFSELYLAHLVISHKFTYSNILEMHAVAKWFERLVYPAHHQRLESLAQLLSLEDNQKNARELLDHLASESPDASIYDHSPQPTLLGRLHIQKRNRSGYSSEDLFAIARTNFGLKINKGSHPPIVTQREIQHSSD